MDSCSDMKFSFIIPTLNEEKLLPSLLNQLNDAALRSRYNIEIIISDGGSTDNTVACSCDAADYITVNYDRSTENIASGRNRGAVSATGDILIFINADVLIPDPYAFLERICSRFEDESVAALGCFVETFPEETIWKDRIFHFWNNYYFYFVNKLGIGISRGECQIVRRDYFDKAGGYREHLYAGEDFDLYKRLNKYGKTTLCRDLIVYESPRRFRKFGYLNVVASWTKNGLYLIFKDRSLSKSWEEVR